MSSRPSIEEAFEHLTLPSKPLGYNANCRKGNNLCIKFHDTVEGILLLQYNTSIVKTKCEQFLKKESKKALKSKYELFIKYNCDIKRLRDSITTHAELKQAVGRDLSKMDPKVMSLVLQRSFSFA
ncbi:unnamed protein product [Caenorhabditis brenneri]